MNLFLRRLISGSMKFIKETLPCCVSLLKPSESDRLPKLNASLLLSGSRELFVQIYRFSFAGLPQNILTESLVMYHIQIQTQKQVKQNEQNFISHGFCRKRRYVACVMKVLHVVVSLHHLSRREVGHHLPHTRH